MPFSILADPELEIDIRYIPTSLFILQIFNRQPADDVITSRVQ